MFASYFIVDQWLLKTIIKTLNYAHRLNYTTLTYRKIKSGDVDRVRTVNLGQHLAKFHIKFPIASIKLFIGGIFLNEIPNMGTIMWSMNFSEKVTCIIKL